MTWQGHSGVAHDLQLVATLVPRCRPVPQGQLIALRAQACALDMQCDQLIDTYSNQLFCRLRRKSSTALGAGGP